MADVPALPKAEPVAVSQLRPHPRNYKTHPAGQVEHIGQSLREHGQYRNVVAARDWTILAGHGVVEAATSIGLATVDVIRLDIDADSPQAIKIMTADNELGRFAEVDDRMLTDHLRQLAELGELYGTGYDEQMLANLVYVTRPELEVPTIDHAAEWAGAGLPEFDPYHHPLKVVFSCESADARDDLLRRLEVTSIAHKDRGTWSVRWPLQEKEDLASLYFRPGEAQ